jgi:hypothetical protein
MMKTIMRNLTGALFVAAVALGTARPQSAAQEIRLSDIRAQQPPESIYASAPCQQAREGPYAGMERFPVYPNTFVPDIKTLMERSDEVILAARLDDATVISPNGKSTARYEEVGVIHSWKGAHPVGSTLTFGRRGGIVECSPNHGEKLFSAVPKGKFLPGLAKGGYGGLYVLFLKHAQGEETQLVQGLLPAAGEGLQGVFQIEVPTEWNQYCLGVLGGNGNVRRCDSFLEALQSPLLIHYAFDPLAGRYYGKPASDFMQEVQSMAAGQGFAEKSSLR